MKVHEAMNTEIYDLQVILYQQQASDCTTLELVEVQQQQITCLEDEVKVLCRIIMDLQHKNNQSMSPIGEPPRVISLNFPTDSTD